MSGELIIALCLNPLNLAAGIGDPRAILSATEFEAYQRRANDGLWPIQMISLAYVNLFFYLIELLMISYV